jgi:hypothetical protein
MDDLLSVVKVLTLPVTMHGQYAHTDKHGLGEEVLLVSRLNGLMVRTLVRKMEHR